MGHQQGAGGYRSIQAAFASGSFAREDTRSNILNNVPREKDVAGARQFEAYTGSSLVEFKKMSDQDMAKTFLKYWDTKFDHIAIPEKGHQAGRRGACHAAGPAGPHAAASSRTSGRGRQAGRPRRDSAHRCARDGHQVRQRAVRDQYQGPQALPPWRGWQAAEAGLHRLLRLGVRAAERHHARDQPEGRSHRVRSPGHAGARPERFRRNRQESLRQFRRAVAGPGRVQARRAEGRHGHRRGRRQDPARALEGHRPHPDGGARPEERRVAGQPVQRHQRREHPAAGRLPGQPQERQAVRVRPAGQGA